MWGFFFNLSCNVLGRLVFAGLCWEEFDCVIKHCFGWLAREDLSERFVYDCCCNYLWVLYSIEELSKCAENYSSLLVKVAFVLMSVECGSCLSFAATVSIRLMEWIRLGIRRRKDIKSTFPNGESMDLIERSKRKIRMRNNSERVILGFDFCNNVPIIFF